MADRLANKTNEIAPVFDELSAMADKMANISVKSWYEVAILSDIYDIVFDNANKKLPLLIFLHPKPTTFNFIYLIIYKIQGISAFAVALSALTNNIFESL